MKLTLKNKMLVAIETVLNEGDKKGGIPNNLELSPQEAAELVWEINGLHMERDTLKDRVKVLDNIEIKQQNKSNDTVVTLPTFTIYGHTKPTKEQVKVFLTQWFHGDITVTYKFNQFKIPLLIVQKPETKQIEVKEDNPWVTNQEK